jgi:hypothetical protein
MQRSDLEAAPDTHAVCIFAASSTDDGEHYRREQLPTQERRHQFHEHVLVVQLALRFVSMPSA